MGCHDGETCWNSGALVPDVKSEVISNDGLYLAVGGQDNTLKVWDLTTKQELFSVTDAHGPGIIGFVHSGIISIDFSPDNTLMATGGADGYVKIWDLNTAETIYEWRADPRNNLWEGYKQYANGVTSVTFSPDGQYLAASTDSNQDELGNFDGGLIKIYDLTTGIDILVIEDVPGRIWSLDFSGDGHFIASASGSGGAIIWDLATGMEVTHPAESYDFGVWRIIIAPDGKHLFMEMDNLVVFDLETEEILQEIPNAATSYVVSPDGNHLAASGTDGRIHIFALDYAELLEIARSRVTRRLTDAECRDYLHLESCP